MRDSFQSIFLSFIFQSIHRLQNVLRLRDVVRFCNADSKQKNAHTDAHHTARIHKRHSSTPARPHTSSHIEMKALFWGSFRNAEYADEHTHHCVAHAFIPSIQSYIECQSPFLCKYASHTRAQFNAHTKRSSML